MSEKEFYSYIQELQRFYGQKLSDVEMNIWYENLKNISAKRFSFILSEVYKTSKFMPKLADVLQANNSMQYVKTQTNEIKGDCEKCNNTGYVPYWKEVNGVKYQYMAVCDCGRQNRYDGRNSIDAKNKSNYFIPTIKELNLQEKL